MTRPCGTSQRRMWNTKQEQGSTLLYSRRLVPPVSPWVRIPPNSASGSSNEKLQKLPKSNYLHKYCRRRNLLHFFFLRSGSGWLSGMYFHGARFSNYVVWLKDSIQLVITILLIIMIIYWIVSLYLNRRVNVRYLRDIQ